MEYYLWSKIECFIEVITSRNVPSITTWSSFQIVLAVMLFNFQIVCFVLQFSHRFLAICSSPFNNTLIEGVLNVQSICLEKEAALLWIVMVATLLTKFRIWLIYLIILADFMFWKGKMSLLGSGYNYSIELDAYLVWWKNHNGEIGSLATIINSGKFSLLQICKGV